MKDKILKILFAGDFAPVRVADNQIFKVDSELKKVIEQNDLFFINLEAPITESSKNRIKAGVNNKIKQVHAELLSEINVTGVSLANNHIFDFGNDGVFDTTKYLNEKSIRYWGVGENREKACEPIIFEKNGMEVAIVSYAEHEFNWLSDNQWCTSILDPASNVLQIRELSKKYDFVIVYTHIGPENWNYPSPRQISLFRNFINAGANAVLNSHSHSIMGMEWYKERPIYYSLGNFFFPGLNSEDSWYKGLIVELKLNDCNRKVKSTQIPVRFSNGEIALENNTENFKKSFEVFSEGLKDNSFMQNKWDEFGKHEQKKLIQEALKGLVAIFLGFFLGPFSKRLRIIKLKGIAIFRGLTNCENHAENIANIFNNKMNSFKAK